MSRKWFVETKIMKTKSSCHPFLFIVVRETGQKTFEERRRRQRDLQANVLIQELNKKAKQIGSDEISTVSKQSSREFLLRKDRRQWRYSSLLWSTFSLFFLPVSFCTLFLGKALSSGFSRNFWFLFRFWVSERRRLIKQFHWADECDCLAHLSHSNLLQVRPTRKSK